MSASQSRVLTSIPINDFGAYLRFLRERARLPKGDLVSAFPDFFAEHGVSAFELTADMYRKLEKGVRAPQFEELLPLLATFISACRMGPQDIQTCVRLARLKISSLQRRKPKERPESEWRMLEIQLKQLYAEENRGGSSEPIRALERPVARPRISFDTSHLQGRDAWLDDMMAYLDTQKKIVTITGMMGVGKTSGLKLLLQRLLEYERIYPIFYSFSFSPDIRPVDHLHAFLASLLTELHDADPEASKTQPLQSQIKQVFDRLASFGQRVVILVDDGQVVLDSEGQFSAEWRAFLQAFVSSAHQSLLYWAAREWPMWSGRDLSLIVEGEVSLLPPLSAEACVEVWKRFGLADVPDDLLVQASARLGFNPFLIELRAGSLTRPRVAFSWRQNTETSVRSGKGTHQQLIEALLADSQIFDIHDVDVRKQLRQLLTRRLTQDALQLLEILAASPIPLPFPLLVEACEEAEYALAELVRLSLVDRTALRNQRACLQPLTREAGLHNLLAERRLPAVEAQLTQLYQLWLDAGIFLDEQEMSTLVTELALLWLKTDHLLDAAQLLIEHGWLSFAFGSGPRLARVADEAMSKPEWRDGGENEVGGVLLFHYLGQYAGRANKTAKRAEDYRHLVAIAREKQISLSLPTEIQIMHYQLLASLNKNLFDDAHYLLDIISERIQSYRGTLASVSYLSDVALFYGTWGDYAKEQKDGVTELTQREKAIAAHQEAIAILEDLLWNTTPLTAIRVQKDLARHLNNLSYHLIELNRQKEAIPFLRRSIDLKRQLHALPYSLAAGLGELAQALVADGQYQEGLSHCEEALQLVQKAADAGNAIAYAELPIHKINFARILVRVGQWDHAEEMIRESEAQGVREERRIYLTHAKEVLAEIQGCRQAAAVLGRCYLDWRWLQRYRECIDYDVFWWLSHSGPFNSDEQAEWLRLFPHHKDDQVKQALAGLIKRARDRELEAARRERREPQLCYPAIPLEEVRERKERLTQLAKEIEAQEPNLFVKQLYLDAIVEQQAWLRLVEATADRDTDAFWRASRDLYPETQPDEMRLALAHLGMLLVRGKKQTRTAAISATLAADLEQWQLTHYVEQFLPESLEQLPSSFSTTHIDQRKVSSQAVKRFFEEVFRIYKFPNWRVILDRAANNLRIEQNVRALILSDGSEMSVARVRELLSHEIECHVLRSVRGESSSLGLLGVGTRSSLFMEEGLALFYDDQVARKIQGTVVNDSTPATWLGTLAVGLACGVLTAPRSFAETLPFFEQLYLLIRLLTNESESEEKAFPPAARLAMNRCLRTYRGVPDLHVKGACLTKDVVYLRGYRELIKQVQQDASIIDRLLVGITGLEQLGDLAELGIVYPEVRPQWLAHRPDLDEYILSFQST